MAYRCYMLGRDGKIENSTVIECPTDAAALAEAEQRLAAYSVPAIEVWDRGRHVGTVRHSNDRSETGARKTEARD